MQELIKTFDGGVISFSLFVEVRGYLTDLMGKIEYFVKTGLDTDREEKAMMMMEPLVDEGIKKLMNIGTRRERKKKKQAERRFR
jgi:hypothetical protein